MAEEIGQYILMYPEDNDLEKSIEITMIKMAKAHGIPINDITKPIFSKLAKEQAQRTIRKTKRGGIPASFAILFGLKKKKDAIKWIKKITITRQCLPSLILNCGKLGFSHKRFHTEFKTESTIPSQADRQAFIDLEADKIPEEKLEKMLRQLTAAYNERKLSSAHLFERGDEWHLIYFDNKDIFDPIGQNHHSRGPHLHYVSHLWGFDKDKLWKQFENREVNIKSEHIRFIGNDNDCEPEQKSKSRVRLERLRPQDILKIDSEMLCHKDEGASGLTVKNIHTNASD